MGYSLAGFFFAQIPQNNDDAVTNGLYCGIENFLILVAYDEEVTKGAAAFCIHNINTAG
jgi:hypothetical protein